MDLHGPQQGLQGLLVLGIVEGRGVAHRGWRACALRGIAGILFPRSAGPLGC
jgi:hypothetical protein